MNKIRSFFLAIIFLLCNFCFAQIPAGYYDSAFHKSGYELKTSLKNIIKGHKRLAYGSGNCGNCVWYAYRSTDAKPDGTVWDMYTDSVFNFGYVTQDAIGYQCGNNGSQEGNCYSREHSFPKSWWAATTSDGSDLSDTMFTDLNHLFPADQYINNMHNNHPLGEVSSPTKTSNKGYKLGPNKLVGYSGIAFEIIDEYKGDFARAYLYMATRYEDRIAAWASNADAQPMLNGTSTQCFTDWAKDMLVRWHELDPISQKEIARNDSVYKIQHNRNPFIDYPELVNKIWGSDDIPFGEDAPASGYSIQYILKKDGVVIETKTLGIPGE
ncbi:MAG: endonuclease [Bacteroidales bacterium]|jgi:endonuclease I|nr:endonuclease [Bacteroidales bacterium]